MLDTIWLEARRWLRGELAEKDYDTWIAPLQAAEWSPGVLTLEAPSGFFRDWLRRHFLATLEHAVSRASGTPATVTLLVNRVLDVPAVPSASRRQADRAALPAPPSRYTFDNFVVGTSNQVAYAAAQAVVAQPGVRFNPLFLYGGVGLGKTHLLCAIAAGIEAEGRHGRVLRISAEHFVNEMIGALRRDRMERFRQRFRGIATLVIDDIQFFMDKRRSQEEFFHTFNALHDGRKQIVIASDRGPEEMPGIEAALRSRFASGLLAHIAPPDPAMRMALVRRKASAISLSLAQEVEAFLAEGWCSNVRVLEGALTKVEAVASLDQREVDLALVRQVLGEPPAAPGQATSVERIIDAVCEQLQVSREELMSGRRTARIAGARQLAMYLCREETEAPITAIGARLGRDHSTVVHALKTVEKRLRERAELRRLLAVLRARLRS